MEWRRGHFWYNQNGLRSSCVGQSVPKTTYLPDAGFWAWVSKRSDVTCGLCADVFLHPLAQCMMKVWAAEWSEWLWCQTLTSCGFSCPSRRRYLKFDSVPQISHVAFICTEIPPRAIGCFEMDVNMKLFAIYLRPFGCLYSVTALQGHRRVLKFAIMGGCLSHHGLSECVKESERQQR